MQRRFKEVTIVAAIILLALCRHGRSDAAERPLRVAYPAPAGAFLPLWVAQDAGIFKKHGLFAELIAVSENPSERRDGNHEAIHAD